MGTLVEFLLFFMFCMSPAIKQLAANEARKTVAISDTQIALNYIINSIDSCTFCSSHCRSDFVHNFCFIYELSLIFIYALVCHYDTIIVHI